MSQQAEDGESALPLPAKRWRVHKRTMVVVFCVVLLPWILIAIPRTPDGAKGRTGMSSSHFVYGWPFVHLESTEDDGTGIRFKSSGLVFSSSGVAKDAREAADRHNKGDSAVQLNLRLQRDKDSQRGNGYWSDWSNWPVWRTGTYFTPRYVGLFLNLVCVTLLATIVAALCEFKIRRHQRLLRYSIANLLVGMSLLAVGFAWIVQTYRANAADKLLQVIAREEGSSLWHIKATYQPRSSLIFSQLLNYGRHPWGEMPVFREVKYGKIIMDIDRETELEKFGVIARCVKQTQHSVDVRVFNFNPDRQNMLHALNGANATNLYLDFDAHDWFESEFGDEQFSGHWDKERKRIGFEIDLKFDNWNLEEVRLDLDNSISQKEQLAPFLGLSSLQWASVSSLSTKGAEFILETKTKWPKTMEFGYLDEVPEELRQELESEFDAGLIGGGL